MRISEDNIDNVLKHIVCKMPEAVLMAVSESAENVKRLKDDLGGLRTWAKRKPVSSGGLAGFMAPMLDLINASCNGLDKEKSRDFLQYVDETSRLVTDMFVALACWETPLDKEVIKAIDGMMDFWVRYHKVEIAKYAVRDKSRDVN